jgi:hypothetical protein
MVGVRLITMVLVIGDHENGRPGRTSELALDVPKSGRPEDNAGGVGTQPLHELERAIAHADKNDRLAETACDAAQGLNADRRRKQSIGFALVRSNFGAYSQTRTLSEAGRRFSERRRSREEIETYADSMADMFCSYLKRIWDRAEQAFSTFCS